MNYIFGRTTSPFNTGLSAGGSSGGEGSLVSLGGSPLGLGTDAGKLNKLQQHPDVVADNFVKEVQFVTLRIIMASLASYHPLEDCLATHRRTHQAKKRLSSSLGNFVAALMA